MVNKLSASFFSPSPRLMAMGTEDPTPMRSARAKLMMTRGMEKFKAAKAVSPRKCPIKIPSKSW